MAILACGQLEPLLNLNGGTEPKNAGDTGEKFVLQNRILVWSPGWPQRCNPLVPAFQAEGLQMHASVPCFWSHKPALYFVLEVEPRAFARAGQILLTEPPFRPSGMSTQLLFSQAKGTRGREVKSFVLGHWARMGAGPHPSSSPCPHWEGVDRVYCHAIWRTKSQAALTPKTWAIAKHWEGKRNG